ncbi:hypothetical protein CHLRE_16g695250v5 [Chlamydomonas reinhardtii]|uniref:Protein kinase domain-containing protein n=1 Tax=Chlamydomonas reinhardtii TaxID=3055 RepID=A0A2K3CSA8_CHLRE|nr:uncharacterized protein CHLRE_16g695250v5 [Chlamydomonas reinhardtii]PNW71158.1 hypothetical protein CHLRE_16g695250v5 [Chlamydomonas reinhardtii]
MSAYAALAAWQGHVLPRLLAAGTTRTLVPLGEDPDTWVPPPPPDQVFFIATARVPGLTLRELLTQRGCIEPAVARAAVRALQTLHAVEIPTAAAVGADAGGGGGGGRFLHGDVKLSNIMLLLPPAAAEQPPEVEPATMAAAAAGAEPADAGGASDMAHDGSGGGAASSIGMQPAAAAAGMAEGAVEEEVRCVVIDLGLSRLDATAEEQRAELHELEQLLREAAGPA